MSDKNEYLDFRKLLRDAIGAARTQQQFAEASGLSLGHLNRMLNNKEISRPALSTLEKIAKASEGRVSLFELRASCGYVDKLMNRTFSKEEVIYERDREIMQGWKDGIFAFTAKPSRFQSLDDFFSTVDMLYGIPGAKFSVLETVDYNGTGKRGAEKYANAMIVWDDTAYIYRLGVTLFYCETVGGGVVVLDAAFDLETLFGYEHPLAGQLMMKLSEVEGANMSDYPTVVVKTATKAAAERLLKAIFGEKRTTET